MVIVICVFGWVAGVFPFFLAVVFSVLKIYSDVLALRCLCACGQQGSVGPFDLRCPQPPCGAQLLLAAKQARAPCSTTPAVR